MTNSPQEYLNDPHHDDYAREGIPLPEDMTDEEKQDFKSRCQIEEKYQANKLKLKI